MRASFVAVVLVACGGRTPLGDPAIVRADAAIPTTDSSSPDAALAKPRLGPRALIFHNQEDDPALASGIAVVRRATDESDITDITDYVLYWASDAQPIGAALGARPATGKDPVIEIDDYTKRPPGATRLLAYSRNAAGETGAAPASLAFVPPKYVEISTRAGQSDAKAVFDSANRRLFVEANGTANRLYQCKPDGSECTDSVVEPKFVGGQFALSIDEKGQRIFTGFFDGSITGCPPNGGICTAVGGSNQGGVTDLTFDPINGRALGVTGYYTYRHTSLFGVSTNMTGYFTKDIAPYSGGVALAVDTKNQKALVVIDSFKAGLRMLRCGLDGSSCETKDISAGNSAIVSWYVFPPLMIDDDRLLALSDDYDAMTRTLHLYRSGLDGSASVRTPIGGQHLYDRRAVSSIVDGQGHRFVVSRVEDDHRPAMTRCRTDGSACRARMLDPNRTTTAVGATFDAEARMLYVAMALDTMYGGPLGVIVFGI